MHNYIAIVAMLRSNQTAADSIPAQIIPAQMTPLIQAQTTQKAMRSKWILY